MTDYRTGNATNTGAPVPGRKEDQPTPEDIDRTIVRLVMLAAAAAIGAAGLLVWGILVLIGS